MISGYFLFILHHNLLFDVPLEVIRSAACTGRSNNALCYANSPLLFDFGVFKVYRDSCVEPYCEGFTGQCRDQEETSYYSYWELP